MFSLRKFDLLINYKTNKNNYKDEKIEIWKKIEDSEQEESKMNDRNFESLSNVDEIPTGLSMY